MHLPCTQQWGESYDGVMVDLLLMGIDSSCILKLPNCSNGVCDSQGTTWHVKKVDRFWLHTWHAPRPGRTLTDVLIPLCLGAFEVVVCSQNDVVRLGCATK